MIYCWCEHSPPSTPPLPFSFCITGLFFLPVSACRGVFWTAFLCASWPVQVDVLNRGDVIMPQSAYQQMLAMEAEALKKTWVFSSLPSRPSLCSSLVPLLLFVSPLLLVLFLACMVSLDGYVCFLYDMHKHGCLYVSFVFFTASSPPFSGRVRNLRGFVHLFFFHPQETRRTPSPTLHYF